MLGTMWPAIYVIAVITSAVAAFGALGIFPAAVVVACWSFVYRWDAHSSRLRRLGRAGIAFVILTVLLALFLPSVQSARESSRRAWCAHNLLQIWDGLAHYRKLHGNFPEAFTTDADDKPLLSWRVALLPLLERNDIYRRIDHAKPWNDAANETATSSPINVYTCPCDASAIPATNYFAVVDPRTIWRCDQTEQPKAITDAPSATIVLIEAHGREIAWASPEDLTFDEALQLLTSEASADIGHRGRHVVFANGTVGFVRAPLSRVTAEALLTCNGGESVADGAVEIFAPIQPYRINQWAFLVFLLLSLLPIVRLGSRDGTRVSEEVLGNW